MKTQSECPKYMRTLVFEHKFKKKTEKIDKIWKRLQLRETFTRSQLFPYKVQFDSESQKGPFQEGELNIHHGPLLSLHGSIGKITEEYRDLQYYYGSYVITFRWIRPTRLEFFREGDYITVRLTYYVRPWIKPLWNGFNWFFWRLFSLTLIA
jgi:hypothetical protein